MPDEWPLVGTRLALRYRLAAQIQQGGMAVVWRARDELLDREVAVKLLAGDVIGNARLFDLVRREARATAKLSHANITAVYDYAEALRPDGAVAPFVVMELLDGETLAARLHRGPMQWAEAAVIAAQVGKALAAAHEGGVVHRDVTPGNVMLTSVAVKVVDFGISAGIGEPDDDGSGATFGTPAYVAPERFDGLPALPATDVYGLGCLLFEMVAGQPPYPVDTWEELAAARTRPPGDLPADLPLAFSHIVQWCLAEQPANRPSAQQVARLLDELLQSTHKVGVEKSATATPGRRPLARARRDRRMRTLATRLLQGGLLIVTAGMMVFGTVAAGAPPKQNGMPSHPAATPAARATPSPASPSADPPDADERAAAPSNTPPSSTQRAPDGSAGSPRRISFSDAVACLEKAVKAGLGAGEIRADAAQDLLNRIGALDRSGQTAVDTDVFHLYRKVNDYQRRGAITPTGVVTLENRLRDLADSAAG